MKNAILKVWNFYVDGFRHMATGRTLWIIILVKLFIMFFILKMFFFPNVLSQKGSNNEEKENYIMNELLTR
jgi:uncharacterized membrane protein